MLIVFIRTLLLFSLVLVVIRIMGKRQIGQLQPYELVVTIMIADLVTVPMQDKGLALLNGVIPVLTLLIAQIAISFFSLKNQKIRWFICGQPNLLIENGKINFRELENNLYSQSDLLEQLRAKGYFDLAKVECAVLETNGSLSVLPKSQNRPVTPEDLQLPTSYEGLSNDLILDGVIQEKNLAKIGLDKEWLLKELSKFGLTDPSRVLIATIDSQGRLLYQVKLEKS